MEHQNRKEKGNCCCLVNWFFFFSIARNILTDSNSKFQMIQRISEEVSIVFLFLFLFFLMTLSFKTKSEVTITVFPYPTPFPLYFPYCFTLTTWWIVMGRRKIILKKVFFFKTGHRYPLFHFIADKSVVLNAKINKQLIFFSYQF